MALSAWKPAKSDGTLPLDYPHATQFQYAHYIDWQVALISFGLTMQTGRGKWKIQLKDSSGNVKFESEVQVEITLFALGFFGLQLFTWYFSKEYIVTTKVQGLTTGVKVNLSSSVAENASSITVDGISEGIPSGTELNFQGVATLTTTADVSAGATSIPISPAPESLPSGLYAIYDAGNPAWQYVLGGSSPVSEQGYMDPGGASDYVDFIAHVMTTWYSPIYLQELDEGDKLDVVMDSWSLGAPKRVEYGFRFKYGDLNLGDAQFGAYDELQRVYVNTPDPHLYTGFSWGLSTMQSTGTLGIGSYPSVAVLDTGRLIYGIKQDDGYWEYESYDMGITVTKVVYPTKDGGASSEPIFTKDITMPQLVSTGMGRIALGIKGNILLVRVVDDNGMGGLVKVGTALAGLSYSLARSETGQVIVVDSNGEPVYNSMDNGYNWQEVEEVALP